MWKEGPLKNAAREAVEEKRSELQEREKNTLYNFPKSYLTLTETGSIHWIMSKFSKAKICCLVGS